MATLQSIRALSSLAILAVACGGRIEELSDLPDAGVPSTNPTPIDGGNQLPFPADDANTPPPPPDASSPVQSVTGSLADGTLFTAKSSVMLMGGLIGADGAQNPGTTVVFSNLPDICARIFHGAVVPGELQLWVSVNDVYSPYGGDVAPMTPPGTLPIVTPVQSGVLKLPNVGEASFAHVPANDAGAAQSSDSPTGGTLYVAVLTTDEFSGNFNVTFDGAGFNGSFLSLAAGCPAISASGGAGQ